MGCEDFPETGSAHAKLHCRYPPDRAASSSNDFMGLRSLEPPSDVAATKDLWIYGLRTNQRFTLKERPMMRGDLDDFIACYHSGRRFEREYSEKIRRFSLVALLARDNVNLDIFWLKDKSLNDPDLLPQPGEVAAEIVESLEMALERFRSVAMNLTFAQID